jgi:hypothetical protein
MSKKSMRTLEWNGQKAFGYSPPKDQPESELLAHSMAMLAVMPDVHVMRNNVGVAKFGKRWVRYGLGKDSADIIAIVGPRGKFTSIELKREKGQLEEDQERWVQRVRQLGGIAGRAENLEQVAALIEEARRAP